MRGTVVQIDGYNPATGSNVVLRAASHDLPDICALDGKTWWPAIATLPKLRYDLFDGSFGGQITAPTTSITLTTEPWPRFGEYGLADAQVSLWTGEIGTPWSAWTLRFQGRTTGRPEIKGSRAELSLAVDDRWLDTALLVTYAGTTKAEGPAALKGQPKPLALGAPRYVPGTLIDSINSVFQISGHGPIRRIEAALEKAIRYGAPVTDYPTYDALVAAAIPRGAWATALAVGMARFGAPPQGKVCFLVQGDQAGPDGWARLPGQIARRLALLAGGGGRIDNASLDALDAARPYTQSIYLDEQTTAREMIQRLAASVNAVAGVSWTGQLFVLPVQFRQPSLRLSSDGSSLPPVASVDQIEVAAPWKRLALQSERTWAVHDLSDVAFTAALVPLGAYEAATIYREGNIVQYQGSTWLYTNPIATAGNTPPTLPVETDGFWQVMAKAGASGAVGKDGASTINLVADTAYTVVGPNSVSATVAAGWGNVHAHSKESYSNGAVAQWTIPANSGGGPDIMAGLSQLATNGTSYEGITFAIYRDANGATDARVNGAFQAQGPAVNPNVANRFKVHFTGQDVRYYVNDVMFYAYPWGRQPDPLFFVAAMASVNPRITDISFAAAGTVGVDGTNGLDGTNGTNGRDGTNGTSSFVHLAYANSADGSADFTTGAVGGRSFVGIYRDQIEADSGDYHAYAWSRLRGIDGTNGRDGTPGNPGADGRTPYTHFAYATSADGSANFSTDDPTGRTYLGVYTDYVLADSGDYHVYTWSLIKGVDGTNGANGQPGADAYSVTLSQSAIILRATAGGAIKGGELPRTFGLKVMRGGVDVTSGASVAMASSDAAITAGYGNGTVSLTGGAAGWLDVSVSYGGVALGTYRVTITVQRDPPAPASQTSAAQALYANTTSTTYDGSGASQSLLMKANGNGQITAGAYGEYYAEGGTGNYIMRYAGKLQYRAGGGSWADAQAEVTGTTATTRSTGDSTPGSLSLTVTIGGLSAGTTYEIRAIYRKVSGPANVSGAINGDMSAQQ